MVNGDEEKVETKLNKKVVLDEIAEPIVEQVIKIITTDPETIKMISAWNKLTTQEQRDAIGADNTAIGDLARRNIPLYQFYNMWNELSADKKRGLVYSGILPFPEEEIRKIEDSRIARDSVVSRTFSGIGIVFPTLKILTGPVAAYVKTEEFNRELSRVVRAKVAEQSGNREVIEDAKHYEDEETKTAGIRKTG